MSEERNMYTLYTYFGHDTTALKVTCWLHWGMPQHVRKITAKLHFTNDTKTDHHVQNGPKNGTPIFPESDQNALTFEYGSQTVPK